MRNQLEIIMKTRNVFLLNLCKSYDGMDLPKRFTINQNLGKLLKFSSILLAIQWHLMKDKLAGIKVFHSKKLIDNPNVFWCFKSYFMYRS